jgi:dipeptidyl aminopeptidase/acylaminoacyl peptidase
LPSQRCPISPSLGPGAVIDPGVRTWDASIRRADGGVTHVWIYLPDPVPAGKVACVLTAPAGSRLVVGMDLSEDERQFHIPYVQAGMAVVAYSISGAADLSASLDAAVGPAEDFKHAHAGLTDEKAALDYALANVPEIDPSRIYAVGHSSAGTLSLLVAEFEPRIKACVAYAPSPDILASQPAELIDPLDQRIDGFRDFLRSASPINHTEKLKCPVLVFHADDDQVVSTTEDQIFVDKLKKTNPNVTFARVATGGHVDSLLQGIPMAFNWMQKQ